MQLDCVVLFCSALHVMHRVILCFVIWKKQLNNITKAQNIKTGKRMCFDMILKPLALYVFVIQSIRSANVLHLLAKFLHPL